LQAESLTAGVVKYDCLYANEEEVFGKNGVAVRTGLSGGLCPDHFYVTNISESLAWGLQQGFDYLFTESAGLCNRCSPHIKGVTAVCVIDNLAGMDTPRKVGPMLRMADVAVVTKSDIVSQAEREVFAFRVMQANPKGKLLFVNGINGQGVSELKRIVEEAPDTETLHQSRLRFSMPAALCSYCLGETMIGSEYEVGNLKKIKF
jgi:Ni2+-binding GTPase involved in maturation of urease and hydrogenase